ncbi:MAG: APC family permease [Candidatus Bathyarchaeia archaeon]
MSENEREQTLKREVGWYGSFCMGYADVGADIYIAIGLVASYAAGASPIAFLIASITYICTGLAYAELASVYPYAGGAHVYAMKAFNDFFGFIAGWAVMLDYTIDIALFSLATAGYLSFFFPSIKTATFSLNFLGIQINLNCLGIVAFLLVMMLLVINIMGIKESSIFNEILVSWDLIVECALLFLGLILAFSISSFLSQLKTIGAPIRFPNINYVFSGLSIESQNFIYGITLAMTSFIGIESIAQAAEETRRPDRWIPRANKLSIISVLVFAIGLSAVGLGIIPWQGLAEAQENPMAAIAGSIPFIGKYLAPVVALTGFAICYVSTNTGIIGVSRVTFSMGRFKLMPRWFFKVHPKYRTPIRTIVIFGLIGASLAMVGELYFVADLYNFGALLSYLMVNVSLIALRNLEPEAYRAWKVPIDLKLKFRRKNLSIPVVGLIGSISCAAIWFLVLAYHPAGRVLGFAWIICGLIIFYWYRKAIGISVFSNETGRKIKPGGYVFDALVLIRTPEDENTVVKSLKRALDQRFRLTLFNIIDPNQYGLSVQKLTHYEQIKALEKESSVELGKIAKKLKSEGFDCRVKIEVGPSEEIIEHEAESPSNDLIILIKRKTLKGDLEKEREKHVYAMISKYPGKIMVVRRVE